MLRYVVVPRGDPVGVGKALSFPLLGQGAVDDIDDFDQEGRGTGRRVQDLDEGVVGGYAVGDLQPLTPDPSPGGRGGKRFSISPQVVVSARPSARPNSVCRSSWTLRTMCETTGRGV